MFCFFVKIRNDIQVTLGTRLFSCQWAQERHRTSGRLTWDKTLNHSAAEDNAAAATCPHLEIPWILAKIWLQKISTTLTVSQQRKRNKKKKTFSAAVSSVTFLILKQWIVAAVVITWAFRRGAWPLGAVTRQALHSFHSAGTDSSYWAWGTETMTGSGSVVPEDRNDCFKR